MKRIYLILFCLLTLISVSQQLPQYTQYMLNEMAFNPAVAVKEEVPEVRSNSRQQWVGITDAPRTYVLTLSSPIRYKNMGVGMNIYTDIVGPTRRTGANISYAYQIKVQKDLFLSMGLTAGILQWGIDGNKLTIREEGDPSLSTLYQTTYVPDFGAGLYLYKKNKFHVSLSIPQLYQAPIQIYNDNKASKIVSHFYLNAAYTFTINNDFKVEPSFLLKYAKPTPAALDIGGRVIYQDQIWMGATYRHKEAVTVLVGYFYKNYLMIGYSYDFITSNIRKYSSGSHEIMVGLRFSKKQAATWEKK